MWVRTLFMVRCTRYNITICDKLCQWLATGWRFSPGTSDSSINKTDHHNIIEILLKVALNTTNHNQTKTCCQLLLVFFVLFLLAILNCLFFYLNLLCLSFLYIRTFLRLIHQICILSTCTFILHSYFIHSNINFRHGRTE